MIRQRIFTWQFVGMFTAMVLVSAVGYAFVQRINQTNGLVDTARQAARTSERQSVELAGLRQANEQLQADSARRSRVASQERDQLSRQVTALQHELVALTRYLRRHNINVPSSVTTPRSGANRPKAPRPHRPASGPGTPAPIPTPSASSPICALVPMACDPLLLSLPTPLLPTT